jgi:hypothetical protein
LPVLPGVPPNVGVPPGANTLRQVCTDALLEINVVASGETPDAQDLQIALNKANQLFDSWVTRKVNIFAVQLLSFPMVPGLNPQTIGPAPAPGGTAPTFQITGSRPVRIRNANVILNNVTPAVRVPLMPRDSDWWAGQRVQGITSVQPTDFYYRPDWPNGSIFIWPVPTTSFPIEVEVEELLLGGAALDTQFAFPPGYELAFTLSLAELLCNPFERQPTPMLIAAATKARQNIAALNSAPPRLNLDDFGKSGRPIPQWNYRTGGYR